MDLMDLMDSEWKNGSFAIHVLQPSMNRVLAAAELISQGRK
jgi:hypothetical protein